VVACGTPEQVAKISGSHTGRYLNRTLAAGREHAFVSEA
jgi:excinuclease UvrABC ATPase subunit